MKKSYILFFLLFIVSSLIIYISCSDSGTESVPPGTETVTTTISGTVLDEANAPVVGAQVSVPGQTDVSTNASGVFTFSSIKVPKNRFVVNVSKTGYFDGSIADLPILNDTVIVRVYLMTAGVTQTLDATTGGEANLSNGSGVKLTANTVVDANGNDYTGNVDVSVGYLDPTSDNFANLVPGGDMQATTTGNTPTTLYSYGIIKVEMKSDAGTDLEIKTGNQSEITVDIPPSMEGTAPATIPLWHYDKTTGLWKEEGTANKQGDKYVGMVGHFSDWNCDVPEGTATVRGIVRDCNNNPVAGIRVTVGQASATTGADGTFERRVPTNTAFDVQVLASNNFGLFSSPAAVPPLAEGAIHDVGILSIPCPTYVYGFIGCNGTPAYGQVVLSWDNGYNSQFTDFNGGFRLVTAPGKSAILSVYTFDNRYTTVPVETPVTSGDSANLGTIQVCDTIQVGDNEFTVNGDVFNNKTFTFNSDTTAVYGYFLPTDTVTYIYMVQTFGQDNIGFWFIFKGNTVGTATEVVMYLVHNGKQYIGSVDVPNTSATANITAYNGVGGLIEGTFSGTLIDFISGNSATITISNGKFSVVRIVGQKQNEKAITKKIPIEIRKKLHLK